MKLPGLASATALIALAGCGGSSNGANGEKPVQSRTLAKISLTSSAFADGQPIPLEYTCDGANQAPTLKWGEPPSGTKSFALVLDDPDAPNGTFRHWGVSDIPASARTMGGGQRVGTEAMNDFGTPGYGGPCPPKGHGRHHYHFKLLALDVERLGLTAAAKIGELEAAASPHETGHGELIGTYERS